MARLKGGSHVAGDLTVEGILSVSGFHHDVSGDVIFTGAGDLTVNRVQKASSADQLVDSNILDSGSLVTIDVNTKISADLEVTGSLSAANISLEEDESSGNTLKLRNNSALTTDRNLTFNVNDADRTLTLYSNISLNQSLLTSNTATFVRLISTQATGTAPFTVASTTKVTNLNADLLDGLDSLSFLRSDADDSASGVISFTNSTASTSTTTGAVKITGGLGVQGDIYANKVFGAVYNDVAEFMYKAEESEPGHVMIMTEKGVIKSYKRGMRSVVGVHSDSFGYALGSEDMEQKTAIGLIGRVSVFIKEKCKIGDKLISGKNGETSVKKWYDFKKSVIGIAMQNKSNTCLEKIEMLIK